MKDKNIKQVMLREGQMRKVKKVNMFGYFLYKYEYRTFNPVKITLRGPRQKEE
jgi:CRISPR/Cas system CMR-associated protein Cmr3 (group 5 of RAMP superfamily)